MKEKSAPLQGGGTQTCLMPKAGRAWTNLGRVQDKQKDLDRLSLCVSDLGSPWEDGGCEVASADGPPAHHSLHACHRYIGPKFKCLQKVKM